MKNQFFSINLSETKTFTLTDVTKEEIKEKLKETFPNWSDKTIDYHVNNEKNYVVPSYYIGNIDAVREQIAKRGTPLNALLRLVKSFDAYYRNGYRQWGNCGKQVIDILYTEFYVFNNAFKHYKNAKNEMQMGNAIVEFVKALNMLEKGVRTKVLPRLKFEKTECIDGRERRLGILELAERVPIVLNETKIVA